MCAQDFDSASCSDLPIIAEALIDFRECAGFEFSWPADSAPTAVHNSATTTVHPADPMTTTESINSVDPQVQSEDGLGTETTTSTSTKSFTITLATTTLLALLSIISFSF